MGGLLGISCRLLDQTEGFHSPNFLEVGPTVGDDTTASGQQTNKNPAWASVGVNRR
jgi:hypothetical protein